jgi:hypothetical protein
MNYAGEKEQYLSFLISSILSKANDSGVIASLFSVDHPDKAEFSFARQSGIYQGYLSLVKEELEKGFPIEEITI